MAQQYRTAGSLVPVEIYERVRQAAFAARKTPSRWLRELIERELAQQDQERGDGRHE